MPCSLSPLSTSSSLCNTHQIIYSGQALVLRLALASSNSLDPFSVVCCSQSAFQLVLGSVILLMFLLSMLKRAPTLKVSLRHLPEKFHPQIPQKLPTLMPGCKSSIKLNVAITSSLQSCSSSQWSGSLSLPSSLT